MKKILTIVGARPQFIKAAVLSKRFKESSQLREEILHTGQHFDEKMSDIFFKEFQIPEPTYKFNINQCSHAEMTAQMLIAIEKSILLSKADGVLVYGDTNSTLAGALAAAKQHVPVFHVEAGLRSYNKKMPEEINRILTDHVSERLFCPSESALQNLALEGIDPQKCENVGDIMLESTLLFSEKPHKLSKELQEKKDYLLLTLHREENLNDLNKLKGILSALNKLAQEKEIIFPIHPRTKKTLELHHLSLNGKIKILEPLAHSDMLYLIKNSSGVITDSGGLQKEAYYLNKPCCVLREETEWIELVKVHHVRLAFGAAEEILHSLQEHLLKNTKTNFPLDLYGTGTCSKEILDSLTRYFQ